MIDHYIQDLCNEEILELTSVLSLPPQHGVARPTSGWLARQKEEVGGLPPSFLRPPADPSNPLDLIRRGLMKVTEKRSLPFVPDAAVLCQAHKQLHPWRVRSIFLLLASECGIRSDRIRRHRGFDGIPPSQNVQDFVYRMTSVSSLWFAAEDFEARFGYQADMLPQLQSGCEACMLAVVGARAELLGDLRANMLARSKKGYEPAFLRFVNAWIEWFDEDKSVVQDQSQDLSDELRQIRREIGRRRRARRKQARSDRSREEEKTAQGYSLPRPPRRSGTVRRRRTLTGDVPPFPEAHMLRSSDSYESGEFSNPPFSVVTSQSSELDRYDRRVSGASQGGRDIVLPSPKTPMRNPFTDPAPARRDDDEEDNDNDESSPGWATQVGSYYFSQENPGARAGWARDRGDAPSRPLSAIHPAFQSCLPPEMPAPRARPASRHAPTEWTDVTAHTERERDPVSSIAELTRDAVEPGARARKSPMARHDPAVLRGQLERMNLGAAAPASSAPSSVYSSNTQAALGREERRVGAVERPRPRDFMGLARERGEAVAAFQSAAGRAAGPVRVSSAETRSRGSSSGDESGGRRNHFPAVMAGGGGGGRCRRWRARQPCLRCSSGIMTR